MPYSVAQYVKASANDPQVTRSKLNAGFTFFTLNGLIRLDIWTSGVWLISSKVCLDTSGACLLDRRLVAG